MKYVGLLLHFYQPPTQSSDMIRKINSECYLPVFRLLNETGARVTVNINYSLTGRLNDMSLPGLDLLTGANGIEFCDSGAYHPILPLVGRRETARQLSLNALGNRNIIGDKYHPIGVFPPEMAFSPDLAAHLNEMGYLWTVTDDVPWVWTGRDVPATWIPVCRGIRVFLRSNFWSNMISFHGDDGRITAQRLISDMQEWVGENDSYIVISMDGETFGHHRKDGVEKFLHPFIDTLMTSLNGDMATLGRLAVIFPGKTADVPSGSWSTTREDLDSGIPYPLWFHPDNPDHTGLWKLLEMVLDRARTCSSVRVARMADRMLYSCPFWWASQGRRKPVQVRRGVMAILRTAFAVLEHTDDMEFIDRVMSAATELPAMTGEENKDAEEGKNVCSQART